MDNVNIRKATLEDLSTIQELNNSLFTLEKENYDDYENVLWDDYNRNMILSSECEENAKKLCKLDELNNLDAVYAADSFRTIDTAKYIHDHDTEVSCWKPIETGEYKNDKNNQ